MYVGTYRDHFIVDACSTFHIGVALDLQPSLDEHMYVFVWQNYVPMTTYVLMTTRVTFLTYGVVIYLFYMYEFM